MPEFRIAQSCSDIGSEDGALAVIAAGGHERDCILGGDPLGLLLSLARAFDGTDGIGTHLPAQPQPVEERGEGR